MQVENEKGYGLVLGGRIVMRILFTTFIKYGSNESNNQ